MLNAKNILLGLLAAVPFVTVAQADKPVYAHFMVGIVGGYSVEDWKADMSQAQAIGIDGFALNCAPGRVDNFTPQQLANAYEAAQQVGFHVFVSFDFAYWNENDIGDITNILRNYSSHPAQAIYNGGALTSTFIGDSFNWQPVKDSLGGQKLTVIPNLQDPSYIGRENTGIDGVFSWYAWPTSGGNSVSPAPMTTFWDEKFLAAKGDKPYMAPVSPWFFTHFNSKNWAFICEDEASLRWEQILKMKPELVEIVTWNDFGESHYISGPQPHHNDDGSSKWAAGFPHDAWRDLMKPYIAAYKSGADTPTVVEDELVYWYRPTPKGVQCSSDGVGVPTGVDLFNDVVFASTMLTAPAELTVTSGNQPPRTVSVEAGIHTFNFTMGVGDQKFSVSRGGQQIMGGTGGKAIADSCTTYNYNAYVGSFRP